LLGCPVLLLPTLESSLGKLSSCKPLSSVILLLFPYIFLPLFFTQRWSEAKQDYQVSWLDFGSFYFLFARRSSPPSLTLHSRLLCCSFVSFCSLLWHRSAGINWFVSFFFNASSIPSSFHFVSSFTFFFVLFADL
jgi:hypothetical protein